MAWLLAMAAVGMSGCASNGVQQATETARDVAVRVRDEAHKSAENFKTYFSIPPYQPPPGKKPAKTAYCYRTMNDVLCYPVALPGNEMRLVGYQGEGVEDPLSAAPPVLQASVVAPPVPRAPYRAFDPQPIFVGAAPPVAGAEDLGDAVASHADGASSSAPAPKAGAMEASPGAPVQTAKASAPAPHGVIPPAPTGAPGSLLP